MAPDRFSTRSSSCSDSTLAPLASASPASHGDIQRTSVPVSEATPVAIFSYEVFTLNDPSVAKRTRQLMFISLILVLVAIAGFVNDVILGSYSIATGIMNLIIALALPFCGVMGVKDKNVTCLQYFCCCSYCCAFVALLSLITSIIYVTRGANSYIITLVVSVILMVVYARGGAVSQQLQAEPYFFSDDRVAPRRSIGVTTTIQATDEHHRASIAAAAVVPYDDMSDIESAQEGIVQAQPATDVVPKNVVVAVPR